MHNNNVGPNFYLFTSGVSIIQPMGWIWPRNHMIQLMSLRPTLLRVYGISLACGLEPVLRVWLRAQAISWEMCASCIACTGPILYAAFGVGPDWAMPESAYRAGLAGHCMQHMSHADPLCHGQHHAAPSWISTAFWL